MQALSVTTPNDGTICKRIMKLWKKKKEAEMPEDKLI